MAIRQLKDGRWAVYYRKDGKLKWEYFGRGPTLGELRRRTVEKIAPLGYTIYSQNSKRKGRPKAT